MEIRIKDNAHGMQYSNEWGIAICIIRKSKIKIRRKVEVVKCCPGTNRCMSIERKTENEPGLRASSKEHQAMCRV